MIFYNLHQFVNFVSFIIVMESNSSATKRHKKFLSKKKLLYFLDILIAALLFLPMFIQWLVMYFMPREKKSVKGKLALITGAGSGFGKAIAERLAFFGCNIAIADINKSAAEEVVRDISNYGVKAKAYQVDVTKSDQIIQLRSDIEKDFGDVDILINNAGIISVTNLDEGPNHLEALIKVNLLGVVLMTKYFLEKMKSQGSGHIVSVSSMGGLHASPYICTYTATKFGVNGFMQGINEHLRLEKLDDRIKTTCIFPYYMKTKDVFGDWLSPEVRMGAMEVNYAAKVAVRGILYEKTSFTIPENMELPTRLNQILPLKIQQKIGRDRLLKEYKFRNPNFVPKLSS